MAILFCRAQVISRRDGRSAVACAAYRSGAELADERTGQTHDYRNKTGVLAHDILAPAQAPDWVHDREQLWNRVEAAEDKSTRRHQAQLARELVIALPHELDDQHREYLLKNILRTATRQGMVADYSIHAPGREGDERNHHAHVMLTMRRLTAEGFGNKERAWNERTELEDWKQTIERETNRMLERCGFEQRVTVELEEGQRPTRHLGHKATALERQGVETELGEQNRATEEANSKRREAEALQAEIETEIEAEAQRQQAAKEQRPANDWNDPRQAGVLPYRMDETQAPTVALWQADRGQGADLLLAFEPLPQIDTGKGDAGGTDRGRAGEASTTLAPEFNATQQLRPPSPRSYASEAQRLEAWAEAADRRLERMKQRHTREYDQQQRGFDEAAKLARARREGGVVKSFNDQQREEQTRALRNAQVQELIAERQRQLERHARRAQWAAQQGWAESREEQARLRPSPLRTRGDQAARAFNPLAPPGNDNRPPDTARRSDSPTQIKQEAERLRRAQEIYRQWTDGGREFKP